MLASSTPEASHRSEVVSMLVLRQEIHQEKQHDGPLVKTFELKTLLVR